MANKMFLIEVTVNDINFEPTFHPIPKKNQVLINVRFSDIINMDIDPEEYEVLDTSDDTSDKIPYNMGKNNLFTYNSKELITELKKSPLELSLWIFRKSEGMCLLPWKDEFSEMVKIFESIGIVKSVDFAGTVDLLSREEERIGTLDVFVRMSCFGESIETGYVNIENDWIFLNPKTMKMFKCANYEPQETAITPVGVVYNPVVNPQMNTQNISWTELFGNVGPSNKQSVAPTFDDEATGTLVDGTPSSNVVEILAQSSAFDVVSMVFRPAENKFFDFLNLVTAEVNTKQDETMVTLKVEKQQRQSLGSTNAGEQASGGEVAKKVDSALELTAEKIERKLCKKTDCPAVRKFKEFGIGPLATGKGLGTLYGDVEPPVHYGLSHTYGTMDRYGPYGVFLRPKSPDQPFVPPNSPLDLESRMPNNVIQCECLDRKSASIPTELRKTKKRLSSGVQLSCGCNESTLKTETTMLGGLSAVPIAKDATEAAEEVVRLRGGGGCFHGEVRDPDLYCRESGYQQLASTNSKRLEVMEKRCDPPAESSKYQNFSQEAISMISKRYYRLRGGGGSIQQGDYDESKNPLGPKSPMLECRSIMEQFDEILLAYKKALGPCGESTCPFAANLADENCKKMCDSLKQQKQTEQVDQKDSLSCQSVPCGMESCVYKEESKKTYPAGCGSTKCAYTKYKLGLTDDDATLELQFLPPAVAGKCGHAKCPYPLQPDLPPIHWDCPDPLPATGVCRNPNCPLQPPELRKLKCPPLRKGPCGSVDCPYALPAPCELPTCPFKEVPCPFLEKQKKMDANESEHENICDNPECPFTQDNEDDNGTQYPNVKGQFMSCTNPNCPFLKNQNKSLKSTCENPNCPSIKSKGIDQCDNPSCPFNNDKRSTKLRKGSLKICDNPNCPVNSKLSKSSSTKPKVNDFCGNPLCPSLTKYQKNTKNKSCDNVDCPFAKISKGTCENPNCPFAPQTPLTKPKTLDSGVCDNHSVSSATQRTGNAESRGEPNVRCSNPNCPFDSKETNKNKTKSDLSGSGDAPDIEQCSKDAADCDVNEVSCDSPDCPYSKQDSKPCTDPRCPYFQPLPSCGIPGCPYEPVPLVYCTSPNCPFTKQPIEMVEETKTTNNEQKPAEELVNEADDEVCDNEECDNEECEGYQGPKPGTGDTVQEQNKRKSNDSRQSGTKQSSRKKIKRGIFVYSMGDKYPGVKVGHRECVTPVCNVPPKMGWLWNIFTPMLQMKPRRGWKPGAVQKTIARRIRAHRRAKGLGILKVPKFPQIDGGLDPDTVDVKPRPTLHIQKKDGAYWITMNPLKDPKTLEENEDPYMDCTPMQFRITKKPKDEDAASCGCAAEESSSSSSSDSELDIEFTPPAGIIHPERFKKKKNVIHCDTQYDVEDFEVKKPTKEEKKEGKGAKGKKGKKEGKGKAEKAGGKKKKGKK